MAYRRAKSLAVLALLLLVAFGVFLAGSSLYSWSHYRAADAALEIGDYEDAKDHLERCLFAWSGSGQVHFRLARCYRILGEFDDAEAQLAKCREVGWAPLGVEMEEKLLAALQGDFKDLESLLNRLAADDNDGSAEIQEMLAIVYSTRLEVTQSDYWLDKFLRHCPNNIPALILKGRHNVLYNNYGEAVKYFRKAVELSPPHFKDARAVLAEILVFTNEPTEALAYYKDLAKQEPTPRAILLGLARCYRLLGKLDECRPIVDRLVADYPQDAEILGERGMVAQQEHKFREAVKWFRKALAFGPSDPRVLHAFSQCLSRLDNVSAEEKERTLAKSQEMLQLGDRIRNLLVVEMPKHASPEIVYEITVIWQRMRENKLAASSLGRTMHMLKSMEKNEAAQWKRLERMVKREIAKAPKVPEVYYAGALAYKEAGGHEAEALAFLRKALEVDASFSPAYHLLSSYYTATGRGAPPPSSKEATAQGQR